MIRFCILAIPVFNHLFEVICRSLYNLPAAILYFGLTCFQSSLWGRLPVAVWPPQQRFYILAIPVFNHLFEGICRSLYDLPSSNSIFWPYLFSIFYYKAFAGRCMPSLQRFFILAIPVFNHLFESVRRTLYDLPSSDSLFWPYLFSIISLRAFAGRCMTSPAAILLITTSSSFRMVLGRGLADAILLALCSHDNVVRYSRGTSGLFHQGESDLN